MVVITMYKLNNVSDLIYDKIEADVQMIDPQINKQADVQGKVDYE
jgi:hypothetical protein